MKNVLSLFLFVLIEVVTSVATAQRVKLPLQPVVMDSVSLDDFFWYGEVSRAQKAFPELKPSLLRITAEKQATVEAWRKQWEEKVGDLDVRGFVRSEQSRGEARSAAAVARESYRLGMMTGEAQYFHVMERALANSLGGWSQSADKKQARTAAEVMTQLPGLIYATTEDHLYINMYIQGAVRLATDHLRLTMEVTTSSPWNCFALFRFLTQGRKEHVTLHFRVPDWLGESQLPLYDFNSYRAKYPVAVNGTRVTPHIESGYIVIDEVLADSSFITIHFPTPIRRIIPKNNPHEVAFQRGPLIYTLLDLPQQAKLHLSDPVTSAIDKERFTNQLSGKRYDEAGQAEKFTAEPFVLNREQSGARVWAPCE